MSSVWVNSSKALTKRIRKPTHVENLGLLATTFGQALRTLALTRAHLVEIKFAQVAIFSLFGHPIQVNPSFVTSIRCNSKLKANET